MTTEKRPQRIQVENAAFFTKVEKMLKEDGLKSVTFTVRGFSMRPFLEDGRDKVELVAPIIPKKGQVILAEIAPKIYALHRIVEIKGEMITMRGDGNLLSQKETFPAKRIIGTAAAFIRKGKRISTDSRRWRYYSVVWELLRPIRRILLAIYRRII